MLKTVKLRMVKLKTVKLVKLRIGSLRRMRRPTPQHAFGVPTKPVVGLLGQSSGRTGDPGA